MTDARGERGSPPWVPRGARVNLLALPSEQRRDSGLTPATLTALGSCLCCGCQKGPSAPAEHDFRPLCLSRIRRPASSRWLTQPAHPLPLESRGRPRQAERSLTGRVVDENCAWRSRRGRVRDTARYPLDAPHAPIAHDDQLSPLLFGHGRDLIGNGARHRVHACLHALGPGERGDAICHGVRDAERVPPPEQGSTTCSV